MRRASPTSWGLSRRAGAARIGNSAIVTDADARPRAVIDKRRRLPFAEYIPFWDWIPALRERYPCAGERAGEGTRVTEAAGLRVGVLNCFEDISSSLSLEAVREGASALLVLANDAAFGGVQNLLHVRVVSYRAVETRRDLVFATNGGVHGLVRADGSLDLDTVSTPFADRGSVGLPLVRRLGGRTLYSRLGPHVFPTACLLGLALAWLFGRRRRGHAAPDPSPGSVAPPGLQTAPSARPDADADGGVAPAPGLVMDSVRERDPIMDPGPSD